MSTQKALVVNKKFGDFEIATIAIPKPGADEVLVKLEAVGLNPVDWKIQRFGLFFEESHYPIVLGSDAAGEVVELGAGVTNVAVGDKVVFQSDVSPANTHAAYQQYTLCDAHTIAKIPSNISVTEAATFPSSLTTAALGLYNNKPFGFGLENPFTASGRGKYTSEPLFVAGGAGNVGQSVIALASASGFSPIIATASSSNTDLLKSLGATHVVDRNLSADEVKASIKSILGSKALNYAYDAVASADTQQLVVDVLSPGGKAVLVLPKTVEPTDGKEVLELHSMKGIPHNVALIRELYKEVTQLLTDGVIKPHPSVVLPNGLTGIKEGLQRLSEGKVSGAKLIALPQETA